MCIIILHLYRAKLVINQIVYTCILTLTELQAKYAAEQESKQKAIERYETAEHQCSMLELDIKSSQEEVHKLTQDMQIAAAKVCYS